MRCWYGLNVSVPSKTNHMLKPYPQCDGIQCEASGRWSGSDLAGSGELPWCEVSLQEETPESLCFFSFLAWEGGQPSAARKRTVPGNRTGQHLDLGFLGFRTVRDKFHLFKPPSLSHVAVAARAKQDKRQSRWKALSSEKQRRHSLGSSWVQISDLSNN